MQRNEGSVEIAASRDRVWQCLTEPDLRKQWIVGLVSTTLPSPPRPGARGREVVELHGRWELDSEVVEAREPELLAIRLRRRGFETTSRFELADRDGTTHVRHTAETKLGFGMGRLVGGTVEREGQRATETNLARLKQLAESQS